MIDPRDMDFADTPASDARSTFGYRPAEATPIPLVSIITPFHDAGAVLEETHLSLSRQTLQSWEWIIVNDASRDSDSLERLAIVRDADQRIKVVDLPENKGRSAARNIGVAAAGSKFIYMLDHDDLLEPTAIEKSLWCLISNPEYGFVNGWSVGFGAQQYLWDRGFERNEEFLENNIVTGRALFRRDVFERVEGYDESVVDGFEDWDLWLRCADRGIWGFTIPEYLDWFRRHDPPASWEAPGRAEAFRGRLRARYPDLFRRGIISKSKPPSLAEKEVDLESPVENHLARGPKRILIAVTNPGSEAATFYLLPIARLLALQGWQVALVALAEEGGAMRFCDLPEDTGPDLHVLANFLHPDHYPGFVEYLVRSRGPEIIMIEQSDFGAVLVSHLLSRCPDSVYVGFRYHNTSGQDDSHQDDVENVGRGAPEVARRFDCMMASKHPAEHASQGADASRLFSVPATVDTRIWRPDDTLRRDFRQSIGAALDDLVIVFWGRLVNREGIALMASTLVELESRGLCFKAVIHGAGRRRKWLSDFLERHDLETRVQVLEPKSVVGTRPILVAGDVFVQPGRGNSIEKVLCAMACGLPVVCRAGSPVADLVGSDAGSLIEPGSDEEEMTRFADAIESLAGNEEYRRSLSRAARMTVLAEHGLDQLSQTVQAAFASLEERHMSKTRASTRSSP